MRMRCAVQDEVQLKVEVESVNVDALEDVF